MLHFGSAGLGATLIGLVTLSGCGGPAAVELPDTVPFSGKVTMDGQPLAGAKVVFMATGKKGVGAEGATDEAGDYELRIGIGAKESQGAVPGEYKVRISRSLAPDGSPQDPTVPAEIPGMESIPQRYSSSVDTELKATIPAEGGTQNFDLTSK